VAFECYPDLRVPEYIGDLTYLRRCICKCCPFSVFVVRWCGMCLFTFDLLSEFMYYCAWETVSVGYVKNYQPYSLCVVLSGRRSILSMWCL